MIITRHVIRMFMRRICASHSGGNKLISILHNWIKRTNDKLAGDTLARKLSLSLSICAAATQKSQHFCFLLYFRICSLGCVHFLFTHWFLFFWFQCARKTTFLSQLLTNGGKKDQERTEVEKAEKKRKKDLKLIVLCWKDETEVKFLARNTHAGLSVAPNGTRQLWRGADDKDDGDDNRSAHCRFIMSLVRRKFN